MAYKPTDEWIKSCATWPAGEDEFLQGVQAMARELLELRADNTWLESHAATKSDEVRILKDRLAVAERVIGAARDIRDRYAFWDALDAYDKAVKGD